MSANVNILRVYAQKNPTELPASVLFSHSVHSLTISDAFPKSIFHFLLLPRVRAEIPVSLSDLHSLKTLLRADKSHAKSIVSALSEDAAKLRTEIEAEMIRLYGFKWPIWTGFHGAPSMSHLHLHVLSADLCSEKMKHKKHYNSFHPKLGFFIDVEEVLSWFDATPSYFDSMAKLDHKEYEAKLKEPLSCFHCEDEMKNMPKLKEHLQEEWDKRATREKARADRKRKFEEKAQESAQSKKQKGENASE